MPISNDLTQFAALNVVLNELTLKNRFYVTNKPESNDEVLKQIMANQHYIMLMLLEQRGINVDSLSDKCNNVTWIEEDDRWVTRP